VLWCVAGLIVYVAAAGCVVAEERGLIETLIQAAGEARLTRVLKFRIICIDRRPWKTLSTLAGRESRCVKPAIVRWNGSRCELQPSSDDGGQIVLLIAPGTTVFDSRGLGRGCVPVAGLSVW